ncbi:glycoside hydrolase family 3 C-terminal domain-containing protein [Streptomyces boninensis]|uniref:glycoside hydrolase family 3 C-terminal domain-containing protein n=1 Tax=Streptomyces boninensis TaxID=2039455 RepID=UPI003B217E0C
MKTCIAILESGRPLIIGGQLPQTDAFVAGWLPGTGGEGITDALFGAGFSGRLPVS